MMYLERVGRRTLICGGIGLLVALLFYSRACCSAESICQ
jgi:hypothetical protein